jgi:hypothetical protein
MIAMFPASKCKSKNSCACFDLHTVCGSADTCIRKLHYLNKHANSLWLDILRFKFLYISNTNTGREFLFFISLYLIFYLFIIYLLLPPESYLVPFIDFEPLVPNQAKRNPSQLLRHVRRTFLMFGKPVALFIITLETNITVNDSLLYSE